LRSRKTKILTTVILVVFRGLKFESDADIGGKDSFRSGTILVLEKVLELPDKSLQKFGLVLMLAGILLVFLGKR